MSLGIIVALIFMVLKLTGCIFWSWWWVIAAPLAAEVVINVGLFLFMLLAQRYAFK